MNKRMELPEPDPDALGKRIGTLVDDALPEIVAAGRRVERDFAAAGRHGSGLMPIERNKAFRQAVRRATGELARLVYEARGLEGLTLLRSAAARLVASTIEYYETVAWADGPADRPFFDDLKAKFRGDLQRDLESLVEDFTHALAWGQPLGPAVGPAGVDLGGDNGAEESAAGTNIPQLSAIETALAELLQEIEGILTSPEVAALPAADRQNLMETGDDIRDEASKPSPDPNRIRRWGQRFLGRLKSAGVVIADTGLNGALARAVASLGGAAPSS